MWKSRWQSWAPVPNKSTVSVDVKQHFNNHLLHTLGRKSRVGAGGGWRGAGVGEGRGGVDLWSMTIIYIYMTAATASLTDWRHSAHVLLLSSCRARDREFPRKGWSVCQGYWRSFESRHQGQLCSRRQPLPSTLPYPLPTTPPPPPPALPLPPVPSPAGVTATGF